MFWNEFTIIALSSEGERKGRASGKHISFDTPPPPFVCPLNVNKVPVYISITKQKNEQIIHEWPTSKSR